MRMMRRGSLQGVVGLVLVGSLGLQALAQNASPADALKNATPAQLAGIAKDNSRHFGDDPDDGGPRRRAWSRPRP